MVGKMTVELAAYNVQLLGDRALKFVSKEQVEHSPHMHAREVFMCQLLVLEEHPNLVKVHAVHDMCEYYLIEMEKLNVLTTLEQRLVPCCVDRSDSSQSPSMDVSKTTAKGRDFWSEEAEIIHRKMWEDLTAAGEYLQSLGFTNSDSHCYNWMRGDDGHYKMIDFDLLHEV